MTPTRPPGPAGRPLVHVRTPTYRRPDMLRRALRSLQAQTWPHWVCDVLDDDREAGGAAVCEELDDPRIRYRMNPEQLFASRNIDGCFSRENPHDADYFCVVEDDNFLLPDFMRANIALCEGTGVEIVLRNQLVEWASGTPEARVGTGGILDRQFVEGRYEAQEFRLSLLPGIGVSNGGLFWSRRARSPLEIVFPCTATLLEYLRTYSVVEPIHVALEPLAVWAENGTQTTRDLGASAGWLRSELDLKRGVQILQRAAWARAGEDLRRGFLRSPRFAYPPEERARGLVKALLATRTDGLLPARRTAELVARGLLIRAAGRPMRDLPAFLRSRAAA